MKHHRILALLFVALLLVPVVATGVTAANEAVGKGLENAFSILPEMVKAAYRAFLKKAITEDTAKDILFRFLAALLAGAACIFLIPESALKRQFTIIIGVVVGILALVIPPTGWYLSVISLNFWLAVAILVIFLIYVSIRKTITIIKETQTPSEKAVAYFAMFLIWGVALIATGSMGTTVVSTGTVGELNQTVIGIALFVMLIITTFLFVLGVAYTMKGFSIGAGPGVLNRAKGTTWDDKNYSGTFSFTEAVKKDLKEMRDLCTEPYLNVTAGQRTAWKKGVGGVLKRVVKEVEAARKSGITLPSFATDVETAIIAPVNMTLRGTPYPRNVVEITNLLSDKWATAPAILDPTGITGLPLEDPNRDAIAKVVKGLFTDLIKEMR